MILRSLFGLTCFDEPLPAATEFQVKAALVDSMALLTGAKLASAPELDNGPSGPEPESKPEFTPDYVPPTPGRRR